MSTSIVLSASYVEVILAERTPPASVVWRSDLNTVTASLAMSTAKVQRGARPVWSASMSRRAVLSVKQPPSSLHSSAWVREPGLMYSLDRPFSCVLTPSF